MSIAGPPRAWLPFVVVVALLGGGAATASAHIQVSPIEAAPDDAVKFTILVPGERAPKWTKKVVLKVPKGVLVYSFEATAGWTRHTVLAKDKSVDQIVWEGHLAPDGFVEFSFLGATPGKAGTLTWKALQYYDDGQVIRWIGPPSSEQPAPQTKLDPSVPVEDAGGEGAAKATSTPAAEPVAETAVAATTSSSGDTDWLARGVAIAALIAALATLGTVLFRRKERS